MEPVDADFFTDDHRPWGFWETMGLSLGILGLFAFTEAVVAIGLVVMIAMASPHVGGIDLKNLEQLASTGWILSTVTWISFPICLAVIVLLVKVRKSWTVGEYLALKPVPWTTACFWLWLTAVLLAVSDLLTWSLGRPIVPEFMQQAYRTAHWRLPLWGALIIAAPVFEELFFRGFMFRGIQASRLGSSGAVLITAFVWGAIHLQYDVYGIATVVAIGILLGIARARTDSTLLVIAMHALANAVATTEAHLLN